MATILEVGSLHFAVDRGRPVVFFLREENDTLEHNRRACSGAVVRLVGPAFEEIGQTFSECRRQKASGLYACGDISSWEDDLYLRPGRYCGRRKNAARLQYPGPQHVREPEAMSRTGRRKFQGCREDQL